MYRVRSTLYIHSLSIDLLDSQGVNIAYAFKSSASCASNSTHVRLLPLSPSTYSIIVLVTSRSCHADRKYKSLNCSHNTYFTSIQVVVKVAVVVHAKACTYSL